MWKITKTSDGRTSWVCNQCKMYVVQDDVPPPCACGTHFQTSQGGTSGVAAGGGWSTFMAGTAGMGGGGTASESKPPESKKADATKLPFHLLPARPIEEIVKVLQFGATKYGDRNWENPGLSWSRLYGAAMRHLFLQWWGQGENKDPETGLSHLAHAAGCILFLLEYSYTHPELDDRPYKPIEKRG
jgi:hypothetical protein